MFKGFLVGWFFMQIVVLFFNMYIHISKGEFDIAFGNVIGICIQFFLLFGSAHWL